MTPQPPQTAAPAPTTAPPVVTATTPTPTPTAPPAPKPVPAKPTVDPIKVAAHRAELKKEIAAAQADVATAKAAVAAAKNDADVAKAQTVLAAKQEDLSEAQGELTEFNEENYSPIPIMPPISVQLMVGPTPTAGIPGAVLQHLQRPQDKTSTVKWHDTVVDILSRLSVPTDGSMVMLMPGTMIPFGMEDQPYSDLTANAVVAVVPNQPGQVGVPPAPVAN